MDTVAPRKGFDVVAYLKLFRFPLVFTAIADSAAGYLIGRERREIEPITLGLLALASSGLYFFGMALNDIADRERDKEIAPGRVLPSGRLTLGSAIVAAGLCLAVSFGAIVAAGGAPLGQRLLLWTLVVLSIVGYNEFIKVPPVMGLVRAFNLLLGVSAAIPLDGDRDTGLWVFGVLALPALIYVSTLTFISTLEDREPDRWKVFVGAAVMGFGALFAALMKSVVGLILGVSSGGSSPSRAAVLDSMGNWHGLLFAGVLTAWIFRRAWEARDRKGVMFLVRDGVGGIIFLDAALVGSIEGLIPALCVAALVVPAMISVAIFKRLA